jgi:nucleotide-binding universal stress UspA family protein
MNGAPSKLIIHPTDRTAASVDAFAHALRIAVATKCELHVLHIEGEGESGDWDPFAQARDMLAKWRMIEADASQVDVADRLGVEIVKATVRSDDPARSIAAYVEPRGCDLLVMMTHSRRALQRWLEGSVAERAAREAHAPALFLREGQKGFVDRATGALSLNVTLMPVEASVAPLSAFRRVADLAHTLDPAAEILMLHVGADLPLFEGLLPHIELRQGPLVETILSYAEEVGANLIAMPTRGDRGLFDELLGTTAEHVLHAAPAPVLIVPVQERRG